MANIMLWNLGFSYVNVQSLMYKGPQTYHKKLEGKIYEVQISRPLDRIPEIL